MKEIKEIIRGLREDRDYKQTDIAEILGIKQQYYSKYETGEYEFPVRHLLTLAKFYNVSMDYLVGLTSYTGHFEALDTVLSGDVTVGTLVSDILKLDKEGQISVVEYVAFLKNKQKR